MRLDKIKSIRDKLKNSKYSIGTWQQIPNASISEILGNSDYDWVAIDMEHGSIGVDQLPDLFRAIELGNTLPLVRLGEGQDCKQALDAGAGGVIVPMIKNAEQLELVKKTCCWPPAGIRSVGFSRANLFGKYFDQYADEAQSPILVAMIEHADSINNLKQILQVEGLDAIFIGPYDLSASLGITSSFDHPKFISAMQQILKLAKEYGIPAGIHVVQPSQKELLQRIDEGYTFIAYSIDAVILNRYSKNPISVN